MCRGGGEGSGPSLSDSAGHCHGYDCSGTAGTRVSVVPAALLFGGPLLRLVKVRLARHLLALGSGS